MLTQDHVNSSPLDRVSPHASRNLFAPIRDSPLRDHESMRLHQEVHKLAEEVLQHADELSSTVEYNSLKTYLMNNKEMIRITLGYEIKYRFFELALDILAARNQTSSFSVPIEGQIAMSERQTELYARNLFSRLTKLCEKLNVFVLYESQIGRLATSSRKGRHEGMIKKAEYIVYLGILCVRQESGQSRYRDLEELADGFVEQIENMSKEIKLKVKNSEQLKDLVRYYEARTDYSASFAIKFALYSSALEWFTGSPSYEH